MHKNLKSGSSLPVGFRIDEVDSKKAPQLHAAAVPASVDTALGPLAAFTGVWDGKGFNTIFRPNSAKTPTPMPKPVTSTDPKDNVLELNVTSETISFSDPLGAVPNRGAGSQADIFLNGVPYLQAVNDVTTPGVTIGIHLEPGLWVIVPPTTTPVEGTTIARMGSIPHGTTIDAQGTSAPVKLPFNTTNMPKVDITPIIIASKTPFRFQSQTVTNENTLRIPQDLTSFVAAGTITQEMLDDPNSVIRNIAMKQKITAATAINISTSPALPLFGGGADNIAFLLGDPNNPPTNPNSQAAIMTATFWIETVETTITVPPIQAGEPPLLIQATPVLPGAPAPTFQVAPPVNITVPTPITVTYTQIQYSQTVILNFTGLAWPHVSVSTLVPSAPIIVPASAFGH
jgi:hypothetical protein